MEVFVVTTEEERHGLLRQLAKRDVDAIYDFAVRRSEEIKRAALSDPEFENRVMEDASYALRSPAATQIARNVAVALAEALDASGMTLPEVRIMIKRLAMDMPSQEIDDAREYMYNTGRWERPDE